MRENKKTKKISLRKCVGCNQMKPKDSLIRFVLSLDKKEVIQDRTMKKDGRGAYVCKNIDCVKKAQKARRFERAFSKKLQENFYEKIDVSE